MSSVEFDGLDTELHEQAYLLNQILSKAVTIDHGRQFTKIIAEIRNYAKKVRRKDDWEALSKYLKSLPESKLIHIVRVFGQSLNLANIAEQRYRIRAYEKEEKVQGLQANLTKLNAAGSEKLQAALDNTHIEMMLTAHSTEVLKRTLMQKYDTIAECLRDFEERPNSEYVLETLTRLIWESWHTNEIRHDNPSPDAQAKWGFAVVEHSLWQAVPAFLRTLSKARRASGLRPSDWKDCPVSFTSWMGGDYDGSSELTAKMTHEILMLSRWMAADLFIRDIEELQSDLSMALCTSELLLAAGDSQEPYRALMRKLREQLVQTKKWAETLTEEPPPESALWNTAELRAPLELCYRSLSASGLDIIAQGKLQDTLYRVSVFGVHLLKLNIRQNAARQIHALNDLTAHLNILNDKGLSYAHWDEPERLNFLLSELTNNRPLFPRRWPASQETRATLDTFNVIARHGHQAIARFLVARTEHPSDILAVILLLKESGFKGKLPIVPLFESASDLERAASYVDALMSVDWYRSYCRKTQQIMIGYLNAVKEKGQLAGAWKQYQAKKLLTDVGKKYGIELAFCHDRGSAIGHDINQIKSGITSQPPDSIGDYLAILEQGEMIHSKLGQSTVAEHTLALYLSSVLEAKMQSEVVIKPEWLKQMEQLATVAAEDYDEVIRKSPDFISYFRAITPGEELSLLTTGNLDRKGHYARSIDDLPVTSWIFAWNQMRLMLPGWLGTDKALELADTTDKMALLKEMLQHWPFFRMQMDSLSLVTAKMDLALMDYYHGRLAPSQFKVLSTNLRQRGEQLYVLLKKLQEQVDLLADDSGFVGSLQIRKAYLDPLHLLQAELLNRLRNKEFSKQEKGGTIPQALRVTMAGISAGLGSAG